MAQIITSQHFLDDGVVNDKIAAQDFAVLLSPVFAYAGEEFHVVLDGHHSMAAAIVAGVEPDVTIADKRDHDAVALLDRGDVEGFLDVMHAGEGDWIDAATRCAVW